ncbi:PiggyBac transposable element-derived protein 4 [Eumeta japonica]|uniref:PiggyBac transposable element-derived protein 4 n=1 Tax=Eumeta variegata TaxID=151549 RepID=A0A4C1SMA5_EUMVA|nr:PiggyBac transposable element-derived protein 4 [Eumeta japonica]
MVVFYRMLDVSAANAYIISSMNQSQKKVFRLNFMKRLAEDLIEPHLRRRVNQFGLQRELQNAIRRVLKIDEQPSTSSAGSSDKLESRKTCSTCDPKKKPSLKSEPRPIEKLKLQDGKTESNIESEGSKSKTGSRSIQCLGSYKFSRHTAGVEGSCVAWCVLDKLCQFKVWVESVRPHVHVCHTDSDLSGEEAEDNSILYVDEEELNRHHESDEENDEHEMRNEELSECVTVDEMLVKFHGRSQIISYMPKKPGKYGLIIRALCDTKTFYFYNGYIYAGEGSDSIGMTSEEKKYLILTQCVLRLTKPIQGSNRNVTTDNWFSSVELVDKLAKRNLTYVGTVKKNKCEVPITSIARPERTPPRDRSQRSYLTIRFFVQIAAPLLLAILPALPFESLLRSQPPRSTDTLCQIARNLTVSTTRFATRPGRWPFPFRERQTRTDLEPPALEDAPSRHQVSPAYPPAHLIHPPYLVC